MVYFVNEKHFYQCEYIKGMIKAVSILLFSLDNGSSLYVKNRLTISRMACFIISNLGLFGNYYRNIF